MTDSAWCTVPTPTGEELTCRNPNMFENMYQSLLQPQTAIAFLHPWILMERHGHHLPGTDHGLEVLIWHYSNIVSMKHLYLNIISVMKPTVLLASVADPGSFPNLPGLVSRESSHHGRSEQTHERLGVCYTLRKVGEWCTNHSPEGIEQNLTGDIECYQKGVDKSTSQVVLRTLTSTFHIADNMSIWSSDRPRSTSNSINRIFKEYCAISSPQ
jgi:hypothetical protein